MSRFRPIDRKTAYLLPPSVEDWLPEDHLARFIVEAMEKLDLTELTQHLLRSRQRRLRLQGPTIGWSVQQIRFHFYPDLRSV